MKNMIKVLAVALLAAHTAMADTAWNGSYAYFWNGTSDVFFDLNAVSANPDFTGSLNGTLGTLTEGAFTLFLNAEVNANNNNPGGDTFTDMSLFYRLNGGSFSSLSDNSFVQAGENYRGNPGGADFSALTAGTYTLELYLSRTHTWSGGAYTTYLNTTGDVGGGVEPADVAPSSDFFSATFTVVPEPSTMILASLGLIGLVAARRRMAK